MSAEPGQEQAETQSPLPPASEQPARGSAVLDGGRPRTGLGRLGGVLLASAVLPGSGHLLLGRRRSGRAILAVTLLLLAAAVVGVVLAVRHPATAASLAVRSDWLTALEWGAPVLALLWAAVIVSAAVLARPGSRGAAGRLLAGGLAVVLVAAVAVPAAVVTRYADVQRGLLHDLFRDPVTTAAAAGSGGSPAGGGATAPSSSLPPRLNVLLIGSDAGPDRTGVRTDTVILASLDTRTGRTVLFSLPRNLERVPFAPGSVMAGQFPKGFTCGDECLLNAVYRWATDHPALFPGDPTPGITALRSAVSATLGLPVQNYALVDLAGFPSLVDALGGITIRVERELPIGGLTADGRHVKPSGTIKAGLQRMDGFTALQYARSRSDSSDYERVQRQRCLLGAIQREADPRTLLVNFQRLASTAASSVVTDIPRAQLPDLVQLAFKVKAQPVQSLTFTPPLINVGRPDFAAIQAAVQAAIAAPAPASAAPSTPAPSAAAPVPGPTPTTPPGATTTADPVSVDQVCSYS